jgi:bacteriocin biosynthesis cyclodehydratase domain-containing protein
MQLIAPPFLVQTDDTGCATLIRGTSRIRLPSPDISRSCLEILRAFQTPGRYAEDFIAQFADEMADGIGALVSHMRSAGFLVPADTAIDSPETVFWNDYGRNPESVSSAAAQLDVTLVGKNQLALKVADMLGTSGIAVARRVDDPNLRGPGMPPTKTADWTASEGFTLLAPQCDTQRLVIACTDIGAETHLRAWNDFCVNNRVPFLPASLRDNRVSVGPYVRPYESSCYECARARINANAIALHREDEELRPREPRAFGWHPLLLQNAAGIMVAEVFRQALSALPPLTPDVIAADPLGKGTVSRHKILRLPRCPVCSPLRHHAAPLVVDSEDRNNALLEAFK